jgi:hypothetical protein
MKDGMHVVVVMEIIKNLGDFWYCQVLYRETSI